MSEKWKIYCRTLRSQISGKFLSNLIFLCYVQTSQKASLVEGRVAVFVEGFYLAGLFVLKREILRSNLRHVQGDLFDVGFRWGSFPEFLDFC